MESVSDFYFKYNCEKYFKLRDGIEAVFPGLAEKDTDIRRWLQEIESLEHRVKHHIMYKYCTDEDE